METIEGETSLTKRLELESYKIYVTISTDSFRHVWISNSLSYLRNTKWSSFSWNKLFNSNTNKKLRILTERLKFAYGQTGSGKICTMNALSGSKLRELLFYNLLL